MTELTLLYVLLTVAFVLAPRMTRAFFLNRSKFYSGAHLLALVVLLAGALLGIEVLAAAWPLFCVLGFVLFLNNERRHVLSLRGIATCIPFVFSLIASTWFFAAVHDLHLLGYNTTWSLYAALHGSFLGWMFVGCLAFLSRRPGASAVYLWGCYLCLVLFLLVAFGIDGAAHLKPIGVIGLSGLVPWMIGTYAFGLRHSPNSRASLSLAVLSLLSILASMTLAVLNEFWPAAPRVALGLPVMVIAHGFLNAVITVPCFYFAIRLERDKGPGRANAGAPVTH